MNGDPLQYGRFVLRWMEDNWNYATPEPTKN
jgi:hypothetical protein